MGVSPTDIIYLHNMFFSKLLMVAKVQIKVIP